VNGYLDHEFHHQLLLQIELLVQKVFVLHHSHCLAVPFERLHIHLLDCSAAVVHLDSLELDVVLGGGGSGDFCAQASHHDYGSDDDGCEDGGDDDFFLWE
jgi:hypothetical protein